MLFAFQMLILLATVCLVPALTHHVLEGRSIVFRMIAEFGLYLTILVVFGVWVLDQPILGLWIMYAAALILLLEVGGQVIQWLLTSTLKRLRNSAYSSDIEDAAKNVESMFTHEGVLYAAVPLGLLLGTTIGTIKEWPRGPILELCLQITLVLASLILLYFLALAWKRMTAPFATSLMRAITVTEENFVEEINSRNKMVSRASQSPQTEMEAQRRRCFDLGSVVTDLRKIYLYDALHNLVLIVSFTAIALPLQGFAVEPKYLLAGAVGGALLLVQLPYMVGQAHLRSKLIEQYRDSERVDMEEELKKYAPLFPRSDFFTVLGSPLTAGGIVYYLFSGLIESAVKLS